MKKALAILTLALFIGGVSVPVIAASNNAMTAISLQDEEPKKKAEGEKKAEKSKEATKSGDCTKEAKTEKSAAGCEK